MGEKKPVILVVDSNDYDLQLLSGVIEEWGYKPVLADSGARALKFIRLKKPDFILLGVTMPDMDGYEVCRRLKKDSGMKDIPVIFLAEPENEDMVKVFESGGVDYLKKPFDSIELLVKLKTHMELKKSRDEIREFKEQLQKRSQELSEANEIIKRKNNQLNKVMAFLEQSSRIDPLTGLFNRRHAMELIEEEVIRYQRNKKPFSLVMSDIDSLKVLNETYGDDCGDAVLKMIAQMFLSSVREMDSVARWGEEEFLIILPETELAGARMLEERIRKKLQEQVFLYNKEIIPIKMTFGAAVYIGDEKKDDVIKRADHALYKRKKQAVTFYDLSN